MMPQQEGLEAIYQQADPAYGSYEGTQTGVSHHPYENSFCGSFACGRLGAHPVGKRPLDAESPGDEQQKAGAT